VAVIAEERRKAWQDMINSIDMTHNSKKAWATIKRINNESNTPQPHINVTADQGAHCPPTAPEWETTKQTEEGKIEKTSGD